ncbi:MAG: glycosyltransferase family 4 protein [Candidatus Aenigmarchaeota archaeon]|nr:glycosyltransferase family 4 protein [Candidatus Aenigmarchaeota archaeon]
MKVLYIHDLYPPEIVGGGEFYAENLVTQLKKRGIEMMVLCGTKGRTRTETRNGVKVKRIHFNTRRELMFKVREMKKAMKEFRPDVVHTNAFTVCAPSYFAARSLGIPVVVNLHFLFLDEYFRYHNMAKAYAFMNMEKAILKIPYDKIIALSYEIMHNLKELNLDKKSVLIEHAINTKIFKNKKKPKRFTIASYTTTEASKGFDIFLDLRKKVKDADFIVYGKTTEEMRKELEKYNIKYYGIVPYPKLIKFLNNASVFFGHGLAAKDAMASGCPTILNESTPRLMNYHHKELKAGVMLHGDPVKIINKLKTDKKYYKNISKKSAEFIRKNYDTEIIIPKIINVYRELV